ncbi:uncharacterized protein LOC143853883 [Tasmannia lanceolata]|uniref:uncharacterized protein LOC143853883 n=1 Tax=Tasmannia lanceolata TaxID=3420 RepID=UPI00406302FD
MIWANALDVYRKYYGFNHRETLRYARETVRLNAESMWMLIEREHHDLGKPPFRRWEQVRDRFLRIYAPTEYQRRRDEERAHEDRWQKFLAEHRREQEARHKENVDLDSLTMQLQRLERHAHTSPSTPLEVDDEASEQEGEGEAIADTEDLHGQSGEVVDTIMLESDTYGGELDTSIIVDTSGELIDLDSEAVDDDSVEITTEHATTESAAPLVSAVADEKQIHIDITDGITFATCTYRVLADVVHIQMVPPIVVTHDTYEIFGGITAGSHDRPLYHCHSQHMHVLMISSSELCCKKNKKTLNWKCLKVCCNHFGHNVLTAHPLIKQEYSLETARKYLQLCS